ncbi:MAG: hypothetical protein J6A15_00450 [Clostridia bacterium]|nr:hypothetical protein [Clostridia bacterium]
MIKRLEQYDEVDFNFLNELIDIVEEQKYKIRDLEDEIRKINKKEYERDSAIDSMRADVEEVANTVEEYYSELYIKNDNIREELQDRGIL